MKTIICFLLVLLTPSAVPEKGTAEVLKPRYEWQRLTPAAPWAKSYNFQMFSLRDTLWVFHPDGVWYSADGKEWLKSSLTNAISNQAFLDYASLGETILGLGHFEGNIERYRWRSTVYQTHDRKQWQVAAQKSNLPNRFFYHPFTFQNKIWITGGENKSTQFDDIWNSADGIHWRNVIAHAPFGKRSHSQVVQLGEKLFLLNNDVWSSTDGIHWQRECNEIVRNQEIFGYTAVVLDGRIWLIGCNRNGQFESKILSSGDGKTWYAENAPWSPRGGLAACVHKGAIYMTGGKFGGQDTSDPDFQYSNDVWVMRRRQNH